MHAPNSAKKTEAKVAALQAEVAELQKRLGEEEDAEKIVLRHIKLLHQYNERKDAAQILIGRLAMLKGTTIRKIHEEYDLTETD